MEELALGPAPHLPQFLVQPTASQWTPAQTKTVARHLRLRDQRAAAMTLRTVLLSIQALLAAPEPDDPQDAVVARQYQDNNPVFRRTAQHWAAVYAGSSYKVGHLELELQELRLFPSLCFRMLIMTKC